MFAGIDTHKDTLAVAVVDAVGVEIAAVEVTNAAAGFAAVAEVFGRHPVERLGIEGWLNFGRAVMTVLRHDAAGGSRPSRGHIFGRRPPRRAPGRRHRRSAGTAGCRSW